ncbi:MAG: hypothetical protein LBM23_06805 [Propionibacteriaceae bacterium]|jgi:hypothetical protein|nr:hypothetical protein [Propionibacteriaceae bacterium]
MKFPTLFAHDRTANTDLDDLSPNETTAPIDTGDIWNNLDLSPAPSSPPSEAEPAEGLPILPLPEKKLLKIVRGLGFGLIYTLLPCLMVLSWLAALLLAASGSDGPWGYDGESRSLCARLLDKPIASVAAYTQDHPPQGWCVSTDGSFATVATGAELTRPFCLFALAFLCGAAIIAIMIRTMSALKVFCALVVGCVVTILGLSFAIDHANPPDEAWAQLSVNDTDDQAGDAPSDLLGEDTTTQTPSPVTTTPPVSLIADTPEAEIERLVAIVHETRPDLEWPVPLELTSEPCDTGGSRLMMKGRFTTRDFATAVSDDDWQDIQWANEDAGEELSHAWAAAGLGPAHMMKSEWWWYESEIPGATPIEQAHIGFGAPTDAIGDLTITTVCTSGD